MLGCNVATADKKAPLLGDEHRIRVAGLPWRSTGDQTGYGQ